MGNEEFVLLMQDTSTHLADLLVEAEANNFMYHDKKVFRLLSRAYLAVELATLIKIKGDAANDCDCEDDL
jgi:hypothetical protein